MTATDALLRAPAALDSPGSPSTAQCISPLRKHHVKQPKRCRTTTRGSPLGPSRSNSTQRDSPARSLRTAPLEVAYKRPLPTDLSEKCQRSSQLELLVDGLAVGGEDWLCVPRWQRVRASSSSSEAACGAT